MREALQIRFPVRGNEIGPNGAVSLGGVARYCEWSRWAVFREAEAAVIREAFKGGVARAQTIEMCAPITYPDDLVIDIWIARVGRTSLDFGHTLRNDAGTVFANARVTIVQLGDQGPEPFPAWLAAHASDRETVAALPLATAPLTDAFEHGWQVRTSDLDQFRHVNQARYVDHADDARVFAQHAGHAAGFSGGVAKITVSYEREMRANDRVTARLALGADGRRDVVIVGADGKIANRAALAREGETSR